MESHVNNITSQFRKLWFYHFFFNGFSICGDPFSLIAPMHSESYPVTHFVTVSRFHRYPDFIRTWMFLRILF